MLLSQHKDLKLEIKALPENEKDKLLLRLIAKDKVLTEHLHFKLMEDEHDLLERQEQLTERIDAEIAELMARKHLSSKDSIVTMRRLNGAITHHFKVTKDLNSEVELRLHLLKQVPIGFSAGALAVFHSGNEKLKIYYAKSVHSLFNKYQKMHEDIKFDLRDALNEVLEKLYRHDTKGPARELGLPQEI